VAAEIFVDTSAWYPVAVRRDPAHGAVVGALRERIRRGVRVVTTNLVVAETHALLLRRTTRAAALAFVGHVGRPPNLVVYGTPELDAQAMVDWLERYDDQNFSLTDGVSFAVMTERGITDALALDRHFASAGFRVLP
jgi:predicted nucleic acid-binding protein